MTTSLDSDRFRKKHQGFPGSCGLFSVLFRDSLVLNVSLGVRHITTVDERGDATEVTTEQGDRAFRADQLRGRWPEMTYGGARAF